jgi:hypothetical protein
MGPLPERIVPHTRSRTQRGSFPFRRNYSKKTTGVGYRSRTTGKVKSLPKEFKKKEKTSLTFLPVRIISAAELRSS